jgi:hypothetical protein
MMDKRDASAIGRRLGISPRFQGSPLRSMRETSVRAPAALQPQRSSVAAAIILGGVLIVAGLLLVASVLWVKYGTAVFFEMIASGIAACF